MKNQWDERYEQADYYYGTEPSSFLVEHSSYFSKGDRVLCLAEGEGRNAVYLAKLGCEVTAVDSSSAGLEKLQLLADKNSVKIKTVCSDLNDFSFVDDYWDAVVSIWCHVPSPLRTKIHQNILRSLKFDGKFFLEAYTPDQLKLKTVGPQNPDLMPTLAQIKNELRGLRPLLEQETTRLVSEGVGHQGMSAVVQFIGTKGQLK